MVDQMNQAIDVVIPWMDEVDGNEDNENEKIIDISGYKTNATTRPLYLIKRQKYIALIRKQLEAKNRVLLPAFNTYAFYSCEITEIQEKVLQHMTNTGGYLLIMELNETNQDDMEKQQQQHHLNNIDKQITSTLNSLLHDQSITLLQYQQMNMSLSKSQFNSLYFLPNTRKANVPLHPMINCRHGLTNMISYFLTRLLEPIYDRVMITTTTTPPPYSKTFNAATDVIDAMEEYVQKGLLQPTTLFVTLYIHDLSTIISHERMIETLQRFLHDYVLDGRVQGITTQSMINLVRLFLQNQYMLYDHKLYQQIRGSHFNSPFTTILANIYIYYWQQDLVTILDKKNEVFGRCFDEIFFTWNESKDRLNDLFQTMNKQDSHMQMTLMINDHINYLDVNISHSDGNLKIEVAHDLNTEPYSLPYVFGHTQYQFRGLPRAALIRAVQCGRNVFDFANELEDIQLSFQYNRFDKDFFIDNFQLFLKEFDATKLNQIQCGEAYYDQSLYDHLRQNVFNYNQGLKNAKIKRCQRPTIQYRWKHPFKHDI